MKINRKSLWWGTVIVCVLMLNSCVKEDGIFADGGGAGIVQLVLPARTSSTAIARAATTVFEAEDVVILPVKVQLTGAQGAAEDLKVSLKIDDAIVARYNTAWQSNYDALPTALYAVDSYELTIPKGTKEAVLNVKIYPPRFTAEDFTKSYALGIQIQTATAGTISGNYAEGVYAVSIKNKYDGVYEVTGTYQDYVNAAFTGIYPQTVNLVTITGNTSEVNYTTFNNGNTPYYYYFNAAGAYSYFGNWSPLFTLDSETNKVTAVTNYYGQGTNSSGRYGEIDNTANNYYDPTTKTIHVTYYLVQPSGRRGKFTEIYTFQEAR
jgi:Domain of unknown function (DUF1735).